MYRHAARYPKGMNPTRTGLTLIETVLAMTVLIVGTVAVFDSLLTANKANNRATNTALALQEIQAQIETMENMPFVDIWMNFKGIGFSVRGLSAPAALKARALQCGTVTALKNADIYNTSTTSNKNVFSPSDTKLPLRFRVEWNDLSGDAAVEVIYILAYRGI